MISRIHVNQHNIKANKKDGGDRPALTVKTYKTNTKCQEVAIEGPSRVVYRPHKPLDCGARCWVETEGAVKVVR